MNVISKVRAFSRVPILVLTVNRDESTLVQALELGANDYMTKPFRQMELLARIKRLALWQMETEGPAPLIFGPYQYDYNRRTIENNGTVINLSSIENEIFYALIKNSPIVVTHAALSRAVWGDSYDGSIDCIKVHIRHLRQKIEKDASNPKIILTKTGVGYCILPTK